MTGGGEGTVKECHSGCGAASAARVFFLLRALYEGPRVGASLRAPRRAETALHAATATTRTASTSRIAPPRLWLAGGTPTRMHARVSAAAVWAPRRSLLSRYGRLSYVPELFIFGAGLVALVSFKDILFFKEIICPALELGQCGADIS